MDLVVEMLSNVNLGKDLPLLATGGTVMVVGSRGPVEINPRDIMMKEAAIMGVGLVNLPLPEIVEAIAHITAGLRSGTLKPILGHHYPLSAAAAAHDDVIQHEGGAHGKIVLMPWGPDGE